MQVYEKLFRPTLSSLSPVRRSCDQRVLLSRHWSSGRIVPCHAFGVRYRPGFDTSSSFPDAPAKVTVYTYPRRAGEIPFCLPRRLFSARPPWLQASLCASQVQVSPCCERLAVSESAAVRPRGSALNFLSSTTARNSYCRSASLSQTPSAAGSPTCRTRGRHTRGEGRAQQRARRGWASPARPDELIVDGGDAAAFE